MIAFRVTASGSLKGLQRLSSLLSTAEGLTQLHARIAGAVEDFVKDEVASDDRHTTANRLGAKPTGHMARVANAISSTSTATKATLKIPRKSILRAAFGTFTITPGSGKKFLTIPDNARTYGKRASDFEGQLMFKMVGGRFKALCFKDGTVAFWLVKSVTIKEDRSLFPFEQIPKVAARVASAYVDELANGRRVA